MTEAMEHGFRALAGDFEARVLPAGRCGAAWGATDARYGGETAGAVSPPLKGFRDYRSMSASNWC